MPTEHRETDSDTEIGEPVRVGVLIQMPRDPREVDEELQRKMAERENGSEVGQVGWEVGMELGVWEGLVGEEDQSHHPRSNSTALAH